MRRHLVTKGSFYERLAEHGHEVFGDDDFAELYSERMGRPSIPPSVMVRAMLCATHDRTPSDSETSRRTRVDADWKAAMGVDDDFEGIAARTFSLMRARMIAHDADNKLFEATLAKAVQAGIFKGRLTAIIDSSPVNGAGAVADSYELIRGFLRQAVRAAGDRLSGSGPGRRGPVLSGPSRISTGAILPPGGSIWGCWWGRPGWSWPAWTGWTTRPWPSRWGCWARSSTRISSPIPMAAGRVSGRGWPRIGLSVSPIPRCAMAARARPAVSMVTRWTSSPTRPPSWSSVSTSGPVTPPMGREPSRSSTWCDPGPASTSRSWSATWPTPTVISAAGIEARGVEMVAKVPPVTNAGRYPKTDFYIDLDAGEVTCPAGQVTTDATPGRDHKGPARAELPLRPGRMCHLPAAPRLHHSRPAGGACLSGSTTIASPPPEPPRHDPHIQTLLRNRSKVERKIDHLQDLGMRKARYRGRRKTKHQAFLAATVANICRLDVLGALGQPTPTALAA